MPQSYLQLKTRVLCFYSSPLCAIIRCHLLHFFTGRHRNSLVDRPSEPSTPPMGGKPFMLMEFLPPPNTSLFLPGLLSQCFPSLPNYLEADVHSNSKCLAMVGLAFGDLAISHYGWAAWRASDVSQMLSASGWAWHHPLVKDSPSPAIGCSWVCWSSRWTLSTFITYGVY